MTVNFVSSASTVIGSHMSNVPPPQHFHGATTAKAFALQSRRFDCVSAANTQQLHSLHSIEVRGCSLLNRLFAIRHITKKGLKSPSPPTSLGAVLPSSSTHLSLCDHRRIARVRHVATRELSACCRPSFAVSGGSSIANVRPSAATKGPAELLQPEYA